MVDESDKADEACSPDKRPFRVLGIQQIAIGGPSKAALRHFWVDDLPAAVAWLEGKGLQFTPGGIRKGAAGHDVCFIHPKSAEGVLIELVQAPAELAMETD